MTGPGGSGAHEASAGGAVAADLAHDLSQMARSLQEQDDVQGTLDVIVSGAVDTVPGARHASISAIRRRREVETRAATGEVPRAVDQAQYDAQQGPCLDTLYESQTVRLPDLAAEQRWPDFISRAQSLGVGSMLSIQLFVEGDDLGALNLTSPDKDAFDDESEQVALLFAAHAAVAMSDAQQQERLRSAVATRDLVGQAKGILMERFKLTGDQAFALLVRASQTSNRKLHDIADELVSTGSLPRSEQR